MGIFRAFCCSLLLLLASSNVQAQPRYRAGVLHVKFKPEQASAVSRIKVQKSSRGTVATGIAAFDAVAARKGVTKLKRVFRHSPRFEKAHEAFGLHLWYEIEYDSSQSSARVIDDFLQTGAFEKAERVQKPYRIVSTKDESPEPPPSTLPAAPNDPLFGYQWAYFNNGQTSGTAGADIKLLQAWEIEAGNQEVIVAIIDGGVDYLHPDLFGNMWQNTNEIFGNGIDDDQNGYVDDFYGYDFGDDMSTIHPDFHGTHVAGTIGAITNNGVGVSGVAGGSGASNGVRIMSCETFGITNYAGFEEAFLYAADNGAVISQNSWGGGSDAIFAAIDYFIARAGYDNSNEHFDENIQTGPMAGGVVVFAAGNRNSPNPSYGFPASYPPVIAVASTDHKDIRSFFSNYGSYIDICAPGSAIYSTYPRLLGNYATLSGTSMACPHVSGVAALIVSKYKGPGMKPESVHARLMETADNIYPLNQLYSPNLLGAGRLNAGLALSLTDTEPPAPINSLQVTTITTVSISVNWSATGGNGITGKASRYDLRYSTMPISEANFSSALTVPGLPKPATPGTLQSYQVSNLTPSTTYFIALKAIDSFGNESLISNVVTAATKNPGIIEVTPASISETLITGASVTRTLAIRNVGTGELVVTPNPNSAAWQSFSPVTTTVQPGQTYDLPVTLNADGKPVGVLTQNINIVTNDLSHPLVSVPVSLTVTGGPNIKVQPSPLAFGNVILPASKLLSLTLLNNGTQPLSLTAFDANLPVFMVGTGTSILNPGQSVDLPITFTPAGPQVYDGTLSISSNDPDAPVTTVSMTGSGTTPAQMQIATDSIISTVYMGKKSTAHYFNVGNTGGLPLTVIPRLEFENIPSNASVEQAGNEEQLAPGDLSLATNSPTPLAVIITDPINNEIYGLSNSSDGFFRFKPALAVWEAVASAPFPVTGRAGATYLDGNLYFVFANAALMTIYNISSGTWTTAQGPPQATSLITSDGTNLYCATANQFVRYTVATGTWSTLPTPDFLFSATGSLAHNRGVIYGFEGGGMMGAARYIVNENTWKPMLRPPYGLQSGITVDPVHERIYVVPTTRTMIAYDIRTDSWRFTNFQYHINANGGLAFLGIKEFQGMYFASGNEDIQFARYEPDHSSYWLSIFPNFASVNPGASKQMESDIDASGLPPGTYRGSIHLDSNDPLQPEKLIGVRLTITGAPDISVGPFFRFADGYLGFSEELKFPVSNMGSQTLSATLQPPSGIIAITPTSISLAPGETIEITATITPSATGSLDSYIQISTNDPDEAVVEVDLLSYTETAPSFDPIPAAIEATVYVGQDSTTSFGITNAVGGSVLRTQAVAFLPRFESQSLADDQTGYYAMLPDSPVPLTALTSEDASGVIYGQAVNGNGFYMYDPDTQIWSTLSPSPVSAGVYAGGALLDGEIYVANTTNALLAVYTIASDSWTTLPSLFASANINSSFGAIVMTEGRNLVLRNPATGNWVYYPFAPMSFTRRGGLAAYGSSLVGHAGGGFSSFARYNFSGGSWSSLFSQALGQGAAIDPVAGKYYTTGRLRKNDLVVYTFGSEQTKFQALPFFATQDANLVYSNHPIHRGIYFTEGGSGTRFGMYVLGSRSWLTVTPEEDFASPAHDGSVSVAIKSQGLAPGNYTGNVRILSNDPLKKIITVPVTLHVLSAPDIDLLSTAASVPVSFVGKQETFTFHLTNQGTEPLQITGLVANTPELSPGPLPPPILPGEEGDIEITFSPSAVGNFSGTVALASNDPDEPSVIITISATVYQPPVIASNPTSMQQTMELNATKLVPMTLSNSGGYPLQWNLAIVRPGGNSLERALDSLNAHYQRITDKIPNRNDFLEGETGNHIVNGGNGMYNNGNYISTNRQANIAYSDKLIQTSPAFAGNYFTAKYPGLFVLVADASNINAFKLMGALGAGHTSIDTRWLNFGHEGYGVTAVFQTSTGPSVPSVHRLILLTQFNSLSGSNGSLPLEERVELEFSGAPRISYLLFSSANGTSLNDSQVMNIARAFLSVSSGEQGWLTASLQQGTTSAGGNQNINMTFNTADMVNGEYRLDIQVTSNDAFNPVWKIPVSLSAFTNHPPVVAQTLENKTMLVNESLEVPFIDVFSEPDGQSMTYFITSNSPNVCRAVLNGTTINLISGASPGNATITLTARDAGGLETATGFNVHVEPDITTALETSTMSLVIAPNPTDREVTLSFSIKESSTVNLSLINMQGKEQWTHTSERGAGDHRVVVSTEALAPGVYLVRFDTFAEKTVQRLVILR